MDELLRLIVGASLVQPAPYSSIREYFQRCGDLTSSGLKHGSYGYGYNHYIHMYVECRLGASITNAVRKVLINEDLLNALRPIN